VTLRQKDRTLLHNRQKGGPAQKGSSNHQERQAEFSEAGKGRARPACGGEKKGQEKAEKKEGAGEKKTSTLFRAKKQSLTA